MSKTEKHTHRIVITQGADLVITERLTSVKLKDSSKRKGESEIYIPAYRIKTVGEKLIEVARNYE